MCVCVYVQYRYHCAIEWSAIIPYLQGGKMRREGRREGGRGGREGRGSSVPYLQGGKMRKKIVSNKEAHEHPVINGPLKGGG